MGGGLFGQGDGVFGVEVGIGYFVVWYCYGDVGEIVVVEIEEGVRYSVCWILCFLLWW